MKYIFIIIIISALFPLSASAQDIVLDTTYTTNVGGTFIEVRRTVYSNGAFQERGEVVGDTLAMRDKIVATLNDRVYTLATAARAIIAENRSITAILKADTAATQTLLRSPITAMMLNNEKQFIRERSDPNDNPAWTITVNGGAPVSITFPVQQTTNRIRFQPNAGTARQFLALGEMAIIVGYPNAGRNVLYKTSANRYRSIDGTIILQRQPTGQRQ